MKSRVLSHIPSRRAKALTGLQINDLHVLDELKKIGIVMDSASLSQMMAAYNGAPAGVMDAALIAPLSTPSVTTPVQFLQTWLPGFVAAVTQARKIDMLIGVSTVGRFEDEEIVQGFTEHAGAASPYGDNNATPLSNWNTNFERRSVVRFEEGMKVNRLEELRAAAMNYNSADAKRKAAATGLEIERNYVGFYGFNSGANRTYGFLNDPSLPAYVDVPVGTSGGTKFAEKTTIEIIADILSWLQALRTGSGDLIDPKSTQIKLALATEVIDILATPTEFGYSVKKWMSDNYPNVTIESAPELNGANGGDNVAYIYAESFSDDVSNDDGAVIVQMVPTRFMTLGVQQMTKGYEEAYANATAGVMVKRPWAIKRFSGI